MKFVLTSLLCFMALLPALAQSTFNFFYGTLIYTHLTYLSYRVCASYSNDHIASA